MLSLNNTEKKLFQNLSTSSDGIILRGIIKKIQNELIDIRNIPDENLDVEKKARTLAVKILEKEIILRINVKQSIIKPEADDYQ